MRGKSSAQALPPALHFHCPGGEQEDKVLSFQEQTPRDQITVPWDLKNHPWSTSGSEQPWLQPCCTPMLQLTFPRTAPMGTQNQLFPSCQQ